MSVLIIDNYDSFTYNLVHLVEQFARAFKVVRNDEITIEEVDAFDKILLSPGPGLPQEAGIMNAVIRTYGARKSILGICMGMQGIAEVYGAELYNLNEVLHGVVSQCKVVEKQEPLFEGIPSTFEIGHYHSWAVREQSLPPELIVTATNEHHIIMALSHAVHDVKGVQFHPESVMTPQGKQMIANWLNY